MSENEAFWTVYSGLDREGPGVPADVEWAVSQLDLSGPVRICDAGCGSGADTVTLAGLLPEASIDAVELGAVLANEARERCKNLSNVSVRQGDMMGIRGPYDLIWCAGALYFAGITDGLKTWQHALSPNGTVVFSEPVRLPGETTDTERDFWAEYPALTEFDGIQNRVEKAGFRILDNRLIIGLPWSAYYRSLSARISILESGDVSAALAEVLEEAKREISNWTAAKDRIAYNLMIVRPV